MVKRDVGIDLVKVWAIFCVVVIHTCNYELAVGSRDWIVNIALGTFVRGGGTAVFNGKRRRYA